MHLNRRHFLASSAAVAGGLALPALGVPMRTLSADELARGLPPGVPQTDYLPVTVPDGATLPFKLVDGVKVFHLIAQDVNHEFAPGLTAQCYGFSGRVHGPLIEAVEGDRVRIYVTNKLDVPTSIHWHGLHLPCGMDGVAGLTQRPIPSGDTCRYEFTLTQHGTFMYHSHYDEMTQMAMGLMGLLIIHPRKPQGPRVDRDYAYMLSEWKITPGLRRPDPLEMTDFNVLTLNGKIFPAASPMLAKRGERVRIRMGNLSAMDHHPMHIHGHSMLVTETDGGTIPPAGRWPEVSVLVPVGSTRTVEFAADNPGDWAFHCHMTHHTMTQMGHGLPNLVGVDPTAFDEALGDHVPEYNDGRDPQTRPPNSLPMVGGKGPFGYIAMGGMFTVLKVREDGDFSGWYKHPPGSVARKATAEELRADGISTL